MKLYLSGGGRHVLIEGYDDIRWPRPWFSKGYDVEAMKAMRVFDTPKGKR